jgi:hypothetical protein
MLKCYFFIHFFNSTIVTNINRNFFPLTKSNEQQVEAATVKYEKDGIYYDLDSENNEAYMIIGGLVS